MSALLSCLITASLFTPTFSETLTIGVRLFTNATTDEYVPGCSVLRRRALAAWSGGGFHSCFSQPSSAFGLNGRITSYRIAVNSGAFPDFPQPGYQFEQQHFVNVHVNAPDKPCATVSGPNWWLPDMVHNETFAIRMLYIHSRFIKDIPICNNIIAMSFELPGAGNLTSCVNDQLDLSQRRIPQLVIVQLRMFPHLMLPSESVHKSIKLITQRINVISGICIVVTSVVIRDFGQTCELQLEFTGDHYAADSCAMLNHTWAGAYYLGRFLACKIETNSSRRQRDGIHTVRVRLEGEFNDHPLNMMSKTETALRVERLFNADTVGCLTYEPSHTANLLQKSDDHLTSFISGPSLADVCDQAIRIMGPNFSYMYTSCDQGSNHSMNILEQKVSLYRLEAHDPFYHIDELFYLHQHNKLLLALNEPHIGCIYNGYTEVKLTGDV